MEDEEGEDVAFKICSGSLWRSGFMFVVGVWALDGVRGRPAQYMKATCSALIRWALSILIPMSSILVILLNEPNSASLQFLA